MTDIFREILASKRVVASAPCRIDMGGTLDISTFYYPLRHHNPCTFNIALDMRTEVRLLPHEEGRVRVSSEGFESAEFPVNEAPFDHPLGLIFAIATYFQADGVHIVIKSASPPRAALGGSSVASVALIGAFSSIMDRIGAYRPLYRREIAMLAHDLEESVAAVLCGLQDQLAASYGGVNVWRWHGRVKEGVFEKERVIKKGEIRNLERHILLAYCGSTHISHSVNGIWMNQFIAGKTRKQWQEIIRCTQQFIEAIRREEYGKAAEAMNRETAIRREMTPDVLDDMGATLVADAVAQGCGARFTGAGGGGCIWAIGGADAIARLRNVWEKTLLQRETACLLDVKIDNDGLKLPIL